MGSDCPPPSRNPALTFVICSNRIEYVRARWRDNLSVLGSTDSLLVVIDLAAGPEVAELAAAIRSRSAVAIVAGRNQGLSSCRNQAIQHAAPAPVVFLDDDVRITSTAVERIRHGFRCGAHIVGTRLAPPAYLFPLPWYMTEGQLHLLGLHSDRAPVKTWGACMGLDTAFAAAHGLRFSASLGRRGGRLQSGDDTNFIGAMKACGAVEYLVEDPGVLHEVNVDRLAIGYLLRRAYWQGRSEVRRGQPRACLSKEWRRYRTFSTSWRTCPVACVYLVAAVVGVVTEQICWLFPAKRGDRVACK